MKRYLVCAIAASIVVFMAGAGAEAQTTRPTVINPNLGNTSLNPLVIQQTITVNPNPNLNIRRSNVNPSANGRVVSAPPRPAGKIVGHTTCGGISPNGNVQAGCSSSQADFKGRLNKSCPRGSSFNKGTNACWTNCPTGYNQKKNGNAIKCRRTVKVAYSPANLSNPKAVTPCPPRATLFQGKCNLCPTGFTIVASNGRSDKNRCERQLSKWIGLQGGGCPKDYTKKKNRGNWQCRRTAKVGYRRAQKSTPARVQPCPSNATLFNGKCNICPSNFTIVASRGRSDKNRCERQLPVWLNSEMTKSAECRPGQFWDEARGGSCWSCPSQFTRDKYFSGSYKKRPPTDNKACTSIGIGWQSPIYPDPGIFGLKGANDIAIDILKNNQAGIDEMIVRMAKYIRDVEGGTASQNFAAEQWRILRDNPQDSAALNGAMYYRLLYMALDPNASAMDKQLVRAFEDYIRDRRTSMAQDVLNMYDAWKYSIDTRRDMGLTGTHLSGTMNYGVVPPNFQKVLEKSLREQGASPVAIAGMLGGGIVASIGPVVGVTAGVSRIIARERYLKDLAQKLASYGDEADDLVKAVKRASKGAKTLKSIAKVGRAFLRGGGGPLIVTSVASVMIEASITQFISIQKARPDLLKAVNKAKQSVSVKRKVQNGDFKLMMLYWGMASNAPIAANSAVKNAAAAAYSAKGFR